MTESAKTQEERDFSDPGIRNSGMKILGWWRPDESTMLMGREAVGEAIYHVRCPFFVGMQDGDFLVIRDGGIALGDDIEDRAGIIPVVAMVPACAPENLGDRSFCRELGIRYPCIAGSMAHGLSSVKLVKEMAMEGMTGFYGAAGQKMSVLEEAVDDLSVSLGGKPYGFNLIHTPNEPLWENAVVDLYIRKDVRLVEASAYLDMTLPLIRCRVHGIHRNEKGEIVTPNRVIAKASRVELAEKFFSPPPENFLYELIKAGDITAEQAEMARKIPVAQDLTAEADSGGHTDNRPAISLLPSIMAIRDRMQEKYRYPFKLRVGAAGGISTPASAAAAFSMGAAYIMTGTVNQACVESGASDTVREMLAHTGQADVAMAHCADMFEMGVKVQVIKRGTMFPMRSRKLYEVYNEFKSIDEIPPKERMMLEKSFFRASFDEIWRDTCKYFQDRDKTQVERAEKDPRHKMALIFRWYLGQTSHWAIAGDLSRKIDYQVWCGPAIGAFNQWTRGSFLEKISERKAALVAMNILHGAAVTMRLGALQRQGVNIPGGLDPRPLDGKQLADYLR